MTEILQTRVRVDRNEMLSKIIANREAHQERFKRALTGWRRTVVERLTELARQVAAGEQPNLWLREPVPFDHTDDYDAVIGLLEASVDETLEITLEDYRQFVLDEWGWKKDWITSTSSYV